MLPNAPATKRYPAWLPCPPAVPAPAAPNPDHNARPQETGPACRKSQPVHQARPAGSGHAHCRCTPTDGPTGWQPRQPASPATASAACAPYQHLHQIPNQSQQTPGRILHTKPAARHALYVHPPANHSAVTHRIGPTVAPAPLYTLATIIPVHESKQPCSYTARIKQRSR